MSQEPVLYLSIQATPNAPRSEVVGWVEAASGGDKKLKVKVKAPAVEGKANAELLRFLAKLCGVRPGAVSLVQGASARYKRVRIEGVDEAGAKKIFGI